MTARRVAILFAARASIYRSLFGVDVYDERRDARSFDFDSPVVAHPPCALWGRLAGMAKEKPGERSLAIFAARVVRACGGVLEHPEDSRLWAEEGLPRIGHGADAYGGVSVRVFQGDWGHAAAKPTWLYIVGVRNELVRELVRVPGATVVRELRSGLVRDQVHKMGRVCAIPDKEKREATPIAFARMLVQLARCSRKEIPLCPAK